MKLWHHFHNEQLLTETFHHDCFFSQRDVMLEIGNRRQQVIILKVNKQTNKQGKSR